MPFSTQDVPPTIRAIDEASLLNIYASVAADQGCGSSFEKVAVMAGVAEALQLKTFLELGVHQGESFLPVAWSFGERGGYSYGVDPYRRADATGTELPATLDNEVDDFVPLTDHDPMYHTVLERQLQFGLERSSTIIRNTSQSAVELFTAAAIKPDLIHIEGNHETVFVMADVEAYVPLLKDGGVLVIDDIDLDSLMPALAYSFERMSLVHKTDTFAVMVNAALTYGQIVHLADECARICDEARALAKSRTGPPPKVSVSMVTYNQEKFIAQAIESVMMQRTDFEFELVIGEDASTDQTRSICKRYQQIHGDKIRLIERSRNVGAVRNYLDTYKCCQGRYVAFLEGDDFWTDASKLQRQVSFLDSNPDYAICCHNVFVADEAGQLGAPLLASIPETTTVHDLCRGDYIATASCMVRNKLVKSIPDWIYELPGCDWALDILNAEHGKIKFFPETLAAYRRHSSSIWSSLDGMQQNALAMSVAAKLNRGFAFQYDEEFRHVIGLNKSNLDALMKAEADHSHQIEIERMRGELERLHSELGQLQAADAPMKNRLSHGVKYKVPRGFLGTMARLLSPALSWLHSVWDYKTWGRDGAPDTNLVPKFDLLVLDDAYPHPQSAFRLEEFDVYLERFKRPLVLTSGRAFNFFQPRRSLAEVISSHEKQNKRFAGRVKAFDPLDTSVTVEAKLGYMVFAGNAWDNIDFVERNNIPFVFTLYPGGSFLIDDDASDARLRRVFGSPLFRRVIVTQQLTREYILQKAFCPPDRIEFVFGVVTPRINLKRSVVGRSNYGFGKGTLDICFTAHKYMPGGRDKGFDIFLDVAKRLASRFSDCRFHVVGGYSADDLPIDGLEGKITFYGGREPDWFADFYRDKDLILLCNVPFLLLKGAFDGFPTGCGSDAMLHELALFCTDPLKLNRAFADGREIVIVPHESEVIVDKIAWYRANPGALKALGKHGAAAARSVYSSKKQIEPRLRILRAEMKRS